MTMIEIIQQLVKFSSMQYESFTNIWEKEAKYHYLKILQLSQGIYGKQFEMFLYIHKLGYKQ